MRRRDQLAVCGPEKGQDGWGIGAAPLSINLGYPIYLTGCFAQHADEGHTNYLPPLSMKCSAGPRNSCKFVDNPSAPWEYPHPTPEDMPVWAELVAQGLTIPKVVYGHNRVLWRRYDAKCAYSLEVLSDMDEDGVYSTYLDNYVEHPSEDGRWKTADYDVIRVPE